MKRSLPSPSAERPRLFRHDHRLPGWLALIVIACFLVIATQAQTPPPGAPPLSLRQDQFLLNTNKVFTTNTPPAVNWQSMRGVPLTTNAADAAIGSDGRSPTLTDQISYGPGFPTTQGTNQFAGFVTFGALAVQGATNAITGNSFELNVTNLNWPRLTNNDGSVALILRAAQVGAPYVLKLNSYRFGEVIPPPNVDENGQPLAPDIAATYWFAAPFGSQTNTTYYYSTNALALFASQPGKITVVWEKTVPTSSVPVTQGDVGYFNQGGSYYTLYTNYFLVTGEPVKTPQTMYWTEGNHTSGHRVPFTGSPSTINFVYSDTFPKYVNPGDSSTLPVTTNTIWADQLGFIRADNTEGRIFLELLGETLPAGNRRFLGFEIVDVSAEPVPTDVDAEIGTKLPAYADRSDDSSLFPDLPKDNRFSEHYSIPNSARINVYATQETTNLNDFTLYWLIPGVGGLQWPYLYNRYHEYWPTDPGEYIHYARPLVYSEQEAAATGVQLPAVEAPYISSQDDAALTRAKIVSGLFYTYLDVGHPVHRTLLRFYSGNNVLYERIYSWLDAGLKTNSLLASTVATNLTAWDTTNQMLNFSSLGVGPHVITNNAKVGARITAPVGELGSTGTNYLAGYLIQTNGNLFNPGAYIDPFLSGFTVADQGAIIPVNAIPGKNVLEVLWFRSDNPDATQGFQPSYWPAVIGHYNLVWPLDAPEIILASNAGSGGLDSLRAKGTIYRQNDPSQPGYNPNEEHAILLGGQAFALSDLLNHTNADSSYTSDPYVLINFTDSDGRPSMSAFHVRREAPEKGILFDYIVSAGTILQAPLPLPLLDQPIQNILGSEWNYNQFTPGSSADLPVGWDANATPATIYSNYNSFTYQDRKHNFWVYRGMHSGPPPLQAGIYNTNTGSIDPLPALTAVSNQQFTSYLHVSRQVDSLTMSSPALPAGLAVGLTSNGFAISGIPTQLGSNTYSIVTQDTADNSLYTNTVSISVVASGASFVIPALAITSSNMYSHANVTYTGRPPFLAQAASPTNGFTMNFYYRNQAGFDWPGMTNSPGVGAIVPFLLPVGADVASQAGDKNAASLPILYRPVWPSLVNNRPIPTLFAGQTLTMPKNGLPAIRGQSSVPVLYQQSIATNGVNKSVPASSVTLFDPTVAKQALLSDNGLGKLPGGVVSQYYQGRYYFPSLPPNLVNRVFFDPTANALEFLGQFNDEIVGDKYLFLNVLTGTDLATVEGLCPASDPDGKNWIKLVDGLATPLYKFTNNAGSYTANTNLTVTKGAGDLVEITSPDQPVDSYAMSATGPGQGYLSWIVGNSSDPAHSSEPVTVYVARVAPPLYPGELKVLPDPNPLSEVIAFQHTVDLAGKTANFEYDWRITPPVDGLPPTSDPTNWTHLTPIGNDISHVALGGPAGIQSLSDNYVALRYREVDAGAPSANTNWTAWTAPVLAEGFIKRALAGINPFNQRTTDLFNHPVNTTANIITQAGHRWEGDVALNADTLNSAGLIEIYETLLNRGKSLSINAGYNYGPANDALLLAAGYLNDLYNLIGNDALADSANPTIGIGTADKTYGNIATALFAFNGQEPSLLEEELALLRGRDDSLSPGVSLGPVYNRLYWNYTRGIDAGEVIYALNYNILDQNHDGVVDASDAAALFPMGHGDAYGHFLTALGNYYSLIMNPNFDWVPRIEAVTVLGAVVSVDYQDERKFASSAAALAKAGLQVFDLTWRENYQPGTDAGWNYFDNTVPNPQHLYTRGGTTTNMVRYWGMDHWAERTEVGAYINWIVGNAILPPVDPDPSHQGIQKVDRTTVPELAELPTIADQVQSDLNNAEAGFTPLNVSQNAIPFDINPLQVTGANPMTHFEQVYQRAVVALNNAVVAFNDAQNVTEQMRSEEDSLADLQAGVLAQETAYNNQLIELYGTPYTDDLGPGKTYPQNFTGPDLIHFTYVENPDTNDYGGILPNPKVGQTFYLDVQQLPGSWTSNFYDNFNFIAQSTVNGYTNAKYTFPMYVGPDGFFDKPPTWTGQRKSPGKLQQAISALIAAKHDLRQTVANAVGDKMVLDQAMNAFNANVAAKNSINNLGNGNLDFSTTINNAQTAYGIISEWLNLATGITDDVAGAAGLGTPTTIIAGTAVGSDAGKILAAELYLAAVSTKWAIQTADATAFTAFSGSVASLQNQMNDSSKRIANMQLDLDTRNAVQSLISQENSLQGDLIPIGPKLRAVSDAQQAYQALVAQGDRIQAERQTYRQHEAALVQGFRTRDAAFRIFQNEKLERYKTLFDLAARYAYLAAKAYDYETGLLATDQGQAFLNRIVSARALGVVYNGQPQYAGSDTGDPGLSSTLAEMKADWDVLKGRLGFNNPDGYGTVVSLRTENYRVLTGTNSDDNWKQILEQSRVADLRADSDVKRYCLQIENGSGLAVPGIILNFGTTITDGLNLFGNPMAPGDHSFSSSSFATKIFSVGVCFDGYVGMDNPSLSGGTTPTDPTLSPYGLSATPYVYLIPVGQDSMRSPPLGDVSTIRTWNVNDLTIPLPFNVSASSFSTKPSYTSSDSLSEPLFSVRGNQAFRPVSTTSVFNASIYGANGALQPSQYTNKRLIGRSVWNSQWKLVIPGRNLLNDPNEGLERFIQSVRDVKLYFITYSYAGN